MDSRERITRALVEEVLRTGLMLTDVLATLLEDLPDDAFPGEDNGEVLVDMVAGTVAPVVEAAGDRAVADATALLGALADKVLADLQAAMEAARRSNPV